MAEEAVGMQWKQGFLCQMHVGRDREQIFRGASELDVKGFVRDE